ncbi:MAG TPA: SRPBCC family protein [Steroidobacteraceae bacterium]|nr:SRPBCC family protein [Steroidobacteraceae bacterium]
MKTIRAIAVSSALLMSGGTALAAAPWLHVRQSVEIAAPAGKVWKAVENFDGLNTWHPAVAQVEIVEGTNNTVGAVRLLTLKGGGTIKEKLLSFQPAARTFRYEILEGALPVSHYSSVLTVKSAGKGKSLVTWSGRFKRKNGGESPGDNENDKAAVDAVTGVYQAGLQNLKKMLE